MNYELINSNGDVVASFYARTIETAETLAKGWCKRRGMFWPSYKVRSKLAA